MEARIRSVILKGKKYISEHPFEAVMMTCTAFLAVIALQLLITLAHTRYFDGDEYAHLSWAARMLKGQRPYIDFLTFFPPGFWFIFAPTLMATWGSADVFIPARTVALVLFLLAIVSVMTIFTLLRKDRWTVVLIPFLLFLTPIPLDKFIEIRPDTAGFLAVLIGTVCQIVFMRSGRAVWGYLLGLSYAAALLIVTKTLPTVLFSLALLGYVGFIRNGRKFQDIRKLITHFRPALTGFLALLALFALWIIFSGDPGYALYALTRLPVEANNIFHINPMRADLFFYPNDVYYGKAEWWSGVYLNHVLWVIGGLIAVARLTLPTLVSRNRYDIWGEALVAGCWAINVFVFISIVPLKHTQYLIPVALIQSFYIADSVAIVWSWLRQLQFGRWLFAVTYLMLVWYIYQTGRQVYAPKLTWTNQGTRENMAKFYSIVPLETYVLDLDGRALYYKDPYVACCIPFGQFNEYLSRPLPSLKDALERTGTRYIVAGDMNKLTTLTYQDQEYVKATFTSMEGIEGVLIRSVRENSE